MGTPAPAAGHPHTSANVPGVTSAATVSARCGAGRLVLAAGAAPGGRPAGRGRHPGSCRRAAGRLLGTGPVGLFLGEVDVTSQLVSYQRRRIATGEVLEIRPLDQQTWELPEGPGR